MTGNNELELNQATLIEAVQTWLNEHVMKEPIKVTAVVGSTINGCTMVKVSFEQPGTALAKAEGAKP